MRAKFTKSGITAIVLLAVCLLAGAVPVAAAAAGGEGDRPVPPNHGFLFDKDAYAIPGSQGETVGSQAFSKLSLRLYGGYSHVLAADVNEGSDFYFELVELYAAQSKGTVTGSYSPLHGGLNFGADLIYQITPNVGVGLGAGYMRNSRRSTATWAFEASEYVLTAEPVLTAIPVRLGVFFTFPVGGRINLTADAGAAYYAGLKFDATQRVDFNATEWQEMSVGSTEAGSANVGFQGSLGLEYMVSPKMGFFVEAAGRYAKLGNFDRVTGISNSSGGSSDTTDGKLYIATDTDPDFPISMFTIEETPPIDTAYETFREPKFDLSGFSLQAGIRIRL
jgi:hypothetical protein